MSDGDLSHTLEGAVRIRYSPPLVPARPNTEWSTPVECQAYRRSRDFLNYTSVSWTCKNEATGVGVDAMTGKEIHLCDECLKTHMAKAVVKAKETMTPGERIIAGLRDALRFARGDHSVGTLLVPNEPVNTKRKTKPRPRP